VLADDDEALAFGKRVIHEMMRSEASLYASWKIEITEGGRAKEVFVAVLGHPLRAGEMALPRAASACGFARRIDVEHDARAANDP
jgi:hypothetical protein